MTTNLIERKSKTTSTGDWTVLGCVMLVAAGIATFAALSNPVSTDLLMGFEYDPSARTGLRVGAGFAVFAWFASFVASVFGLRRTTTGPAVLGTLVIVALLLLGPFLLFAAGIAFS